jgi:hypothetical protein
MRTPLPSFDPDRDASRTATGRLTVQRGITAYGRDENRDDTEGMWRIRAPVWRYHVPNGCST